MNEKIRNLADRILRGGYVFAAGGKLCHKYDGRTEDRNRLQLGWKDGVLPGALQTGVLGVWHNREHDGEIPVPYSQDGYSQKIAEEKKILALGDIVARLKVLENSKSNKRGGWDAASGVWRPHKSNEGGAKTIGYGIKLSNGTRWAGLAQKQNFLTDRQVEEAVADMASEYYGRAQKAYDGMFGIGEWDALSWKAQSILTDYEYNSRRGLRSYPKLLKAIHDGDIETAKSESGRHSGGTPLKERNKRILEELDSLNVMLSADYK